MISPEETLKLAQEKIDKVFKIKEDKHFRGLNKIVITGVEIDIYFTYFIPGTTKGETEIDSYQLYKYFKEG